ncbi:unnamed protein product [Absidia cylindrospora]
MHSERLHRNYAKQPAMRTIFSSVTFTKQLAKFVEDRDLFHDIYGHGLSASASAQSAPSRDTEFVLRSMKKKTNSLIRQQHRPISVSQCTPLTSLDIKTYDILDLIEYDDDNTEIKTGFSYNQQHNDCIHAIDVTTASNFAFCK